MGIRHLNWFLRKHCKSSIQQIKLSELSGKTVAIDISIYLYKYTKENLLIENMYLLLTLFRTYHIVPLFVFDGKPPPEKRDLLWKRRQEKWEAQKKYKDWEETEENDQNKKEREKCMIDLRKQCVSISKEDILQIKELIELYGASYVDAPGEADELCAWLVNAGHVWACLSEDTDMFVYGCRRVLRYFSLLNHHTVLYDFEGILKELSLSKRQFQEICILTGTDYNDITYHHPVEAVWTSFSQYKKTEGYQGVSFCQWFRQKANQGFEKEDIKMIEMFDITKKDHVQLFQELKLQKYNMDAIKERLANVSFIFPVRKISI